MNNLKYLLEKAGFDKIEPDMQRFYSYVDLRYGTLKRAIIHAYFSYDRSIIELVTCFNCSKEYIERTIKDAVLNYANFITTVEKEENE